MDPNIGDNSIFTWHGGKDSIETKLLMPPNYRLQLTARHRWSVSARS
jgi:hypothetical protein